MKYDGGFEELFDLAADPHELANEADNPAYAGDLATLRALQDKLKSCAGDSCWVSGAVPSSVKASDNEGFGVRPRQD